MGFIRIAHPVICPPLNCSILILHNRCFSWEEDGFCIWHNFTVLSSRLLSWISKTLKDQSLEARWTLPWVSGSTRCLSGTAESSPQSKHTYSSVLLLGSSLKFCQCCWGWESRDLGEAASLKRLSREKERWELLTVLQSFQVVVCEVWAIHSSAFPWSSSTASTFFKVATHKKAVILWECVLALQLCDCKKGKADCTYAHKTSFWALLTFWISICQFIHDHLDEMRSILIKKVLKKNKYEC